MKGDRAAAALTDCEKAQQLGGDLPELLSLRSDAMDALNAERRDQRNKTRAISAAREQIDNGRLAAGEKLLAVASVADTRAAKLLAELSARSALLDSAVSGVSGALKRNDLDFALAELEHAQWADQSDKRIKELSDNLKRTLREKIGDAIDARTDFDVADSLRPAAGAHRRRRIRVRALLNGIAQSKLAWEQLNRGRIREAEEICRRLATIFPKASWLAQALKHLESAGEAMDALRTGPLRVAVEPSHRCADASTDA